MWLGSCYKDYAEILGNIAPLKILEFTEECSEKKGKKKKYSEDFVSMGELNKLNIFVLDSLLLLI